MAKWEYFKKTLPKTGFIDGKFTEDILNKFGSEGWEAYSVLDRGDDISYFFKRQIQ